jgi:hypothetical protein
MKRHTFISIAALVLLGFAVSGDVSADRGGHGKHSYGHGKHSYGHSKHSHGHGRTHYRVYINPFPGYYGLGPYAYYPPYGYYYPSYPYYYPPVVAAPAAPTTYIERGESQSAAPANYWYYCTDPAGYYPYVKECPTEWQKVSPQPPEP